MFDAIALERVKDVSGGDIEGAYFTYKNLSKMSLERYQILTKDTYEKDKRRAEERMREPCFIYAICRSVLI
jgi:hypothetical protein